MKKPTWITIVGVLGIILGSFGILGGGQLIFTPKMMALQEEMLSNFAETKNETSTPFPNPKMIESMKKMWSTPVWFETFCVVAGIAALVVFGFYIFSSIQLLQVKADAVTFFYRAVSVALIYEIFKIVLSISAGSMMAMSLASGGFFGLVFNVVLFFVVHTSDKKVFQKEEA